MFDMVLMFVSKATTATVEQQWYFDMQFLLFSFYVIMTIFYFFVMDLNLKKKRKGINIIFLPLFV